MSNVRFAFRQLFKSPGFTLLAILTLAVGMTFVILTGGIDLSVGSILALSTALTALGLTRAWQ